MQATLWLAALLAAAALSPCGGSHVSPVGGAALHDIEPGLNVSISVDLSATTPISPTLYGIFFEEIGHAGDGGLYAEMVQDRSFDALADAVGFLDSAEPRRDVDLGALAAAWRPAAAPAPPTAPARATSLGAAAAAARAAAAPVAAWTAARGTATALTRERPLAAGNAVALEVSAPAGGRAEVRNAGYWGVPVAARGEYELTLYARNLGGADVELTAELLPSSPPSAAAAGAAAAPPRRLLFEAGSNALGGGNASALATARATVPAGDAGAWHRLALRLAAGGAADARASLALSFPGPAALALDFVSLFPAANAARGRAEGTANPWPFRADLLGALKALRPAFVRFPGGCFVEGDVLANAFYWKNSIGPAEGRPGHRGLWGYWSDDGLGLFEYLQLAEELGAEPVWVLQAGVAHGDSVATKDVWPLVQDALDSVEFATGPPDSRWGRVRAAMGRREPWALNYVAIGNEDCGKPFYAENHNLFWGALRAAHPHLRLVSNCDMGDSGPTDLWDWHLYTNPQDMFGRRREFDGVDPAAAPHVFASEYAVTDGGGLGNLMGAVAEAAFMTGLERNARAVEMAAYAPLFVHTSNRPWPTNLIVFDNSRWYPIPSYHVQAMFAAARGVAAAAHRLAYAPRGGAPPEETVAASATCQDARCSLLAVKVVNFCARARFVEVALAAGGGAGNEVDVEPTGQLTSLGGAEPLAENDFDAPARVAPATAAVEGLGPRFSLSVGPWSVNVLTLTVRGGARAGAAAAAAAAVAAA